MKVVLLEVSFSELYSSDIQRGQMEGERRVTCSVIDELHSSDIQGYRMQGEIGVT